MNVVRGDLLALARQGQFDLVAHGCNCMCDMGKGIALSIKREFPSAYWADLQTEKGSRLKLGTFSSATIETASGPLVVVNAYTQFDWKGKEGKADYDAIRNVMHSLARDFPSSRIGYPKIGAGLAGGDWSIISAIIDEELNGLDHTYVEFAP
jgi:O-acetyl-ADP-ribose deacetylase (regulator of RNase III)